ncbi:MAG: TetR/AcrR family transcriptional regulator [Sphingomonadaceae bacterium]
MKATAIQDRMLSAMHPRHNAEPPEKWQQRKSARTRQRILDAGIDCLVEAGYAGLTTAAVATGCEISRGAMHHHFATRLDLVAAVIDHLFYRRMSLFLDDYFASLGTRGEEEIIETATEAHWRSVHTHEYAAYLQLAVAARSDEELAALFAPAEKRYDKVWISEMIEAFPQWREQWDAMKLASDFANAAHIGMLLNEGVLGKGERMAKVRALVTQTVAQLYGRQ